MDEENQEPSEVVPLWPKSGEEWGELALDLGYLGMIFVAVGGECPEIPDYMAFISSFSIVGLVMGLIRFVFSLRREGNDKLYPIPAVIATVLGMAQLGLGIWGMVLVFPNLKYFVQTGFDVEKGSLNYKSIFLPGKTTVKVFS